MIRKTQGNKRLLNGVSLFCRESENCFSPDLWHSNRHNEKNEAAAGLHISVTTSASVTKNKQPISHHHSARCLNNQSLKFNKHPYTNKTPPSHSHTFHPSCTGSVARNCLWSPLTWLFQTISETHQTQRTPRPLL